MFYEVRVLNRKNKVKKIINSQQLSRNYWDKFETSFNASSPKSKNGKKKPPTRTN